MANSFKEHIRSVGTRYIPQFEGRCVRESGKDGKGVLWSVFADTVTMATEPQSSMRVSTRSFLRPPEMGVFFRQQH